MTQQGTGRHEGTGQRGTRDAGTARAAQQLLAREGRTVERPVGGGRDDAVLRLAYVRSGPRGDAPPVLVLPGGPAGSKYASVRAPGSRAQAAKCSARRAARTSSVT